MPEVWDGIQQGFKCMHKNIAHALTRGMGWGSLALNRQMIERLKPSLNTGSSRLLGQGSSLAPNWLFAPV
jgi:hypothetical protein